MLSPRKFYEVLQITYCTVIKLYTRVKIYKLVRSMECVNMQRKYNALSGKCIIPNSNQR
jgi:hypothetical protein